MIKSNHIGAVVVVLSCALVAPAVTAPIAPGNGQQTIDIVGTRMTVFTYRPPNCSDPSLLLVFHGVARNARTYRDYARPLADRNCLLLVAPLFDQRDFPGWRYQRGGIVKGGAVQPPSDWSGNLVSALVEWVRQQEARPLAYSLLGHSAGGQFLERLAAFRSHPGAADRRRQPRKLCASQPRRCCALWAGQGLRRGGGRGATAALPRTTTNHLSRRR